MRLRRRAGCGHKGLPAGMAPPVIGQPGALDQPWIGALDLSWSNPFSTEPPVWKLMVVAL